MRIPRQQEAGIHKSSIWHMRDCIDRHWADRPPGTVLEIGSRTRRTPAPFREIFEEDGWRYEGLDLADGGNVDVVVDDPFAWHLADDTYDLIISGQMLEHNTMFWLSFLEMARVLRPGGLMFHIAPSRGHEHKAPQDCWRFYRDGMHSIAEWAGLECVEATTDWSHAHLEVIERKFPRVWRFLPHKGRFADSAWGDTVGVFRKPQPWQPETARHYLATLLRGLPVADAQ